MGRSPATAPPSAAALLCLLLCACTSVYSSQSSFDVDCLSLVPTEAARVFLRSRAMQPGDMFSCDAIEHLGLGGGVFLGKDVELFVPALLRMRALKTLDLSHMSLAVENLRALAPVFTKLHGLQRLSFNGNYIGRDGAAVLADSITSDSIEWLLLEHSQIGSEGFKLLAPLLQRQNSTLTWLNLENCGLGPEGAAAVANIIGSFKQLHELNIAINGLGDRGCSAVVAALPWSTVRKLWLGSNALTAAALQHVQGQHLQLLDVSNNNLGPACSQTLATALLQMPHLRTLVLSGNERLSDSGVAAITASFRYLGSLSHVSMQGLYLSDNEHSAVTGKLGLLAVFSSCAPLTRLLRFLPPIVPVGFV